jgi:hypothetical protein
MKSTSFLLTNNLKEINNLPCQLGPARPARAIGVIVNLIFGLIYFWLRCDLLMSPAPMCGLNRSFSHQHPLWN